MSVVSHPFLCIRWPKYWSFSFSICPSNEYSGLISFGIDWFDLLVVQGTLKSLLQHHSSKTSILWRSASFMSVTVSIVSPSICHELCAVCADLRSQNGELRVIKPESNDKETEGAYESDLPEELCGSQLPQQSLKSYNDSPDVIIEAQFDDSDSEDGHGNIQNALVDGVKNLSVCVQEKDEETETQRSYLACPVSHRKTVNCLGNTPCFLLRTTGCLEYTCLSRTTMPTHCSSAASWTGRRTATLPWANAAPVSFLQLMFILKKKQY
ncbi:hypothetical protein FD755_007948 [Muntiacus reevesi]|uniref:Uncharacterized protein n=1 Tax=Muntiacus reevesi TaxID=9886 RepID=A0A5J5MJ06_MUNRE|nr:hypothetical protein FD755_007948 [Muntiacus reevesi]